MNKTSLRISAVAIAFAVGLAGCQSNPNNEDTGRVVGGIIGGVLGSKLGKGHGRTAGAIAGTLLGAYIGGNIGRHMDAEDRRHANDALEHNRDAQPTSWTNPNTGNRYDVTPKRTYYREETPCREYATKAIIGGREEVVYGTACRQADGSWQAAN